MGSGGSNPSLPATGPARLRLGALAITGIAKSGADSAIPEQPEFSPEFPGFNLNKNSGSVLA